MIEGKRVPRYCKQRDWFRCGPLAILNAMKWAGRKVTYNDMIERLTKESKTIRRGPRRGTRYRNLTETLRKYGFIVNRRRELSLKEVKAHLKNGQAAVAAFYWSKRSDAQGHYVLLVPDEDSRDWCKVINMWDNQTSITECNFTSREKQEYLKRLSVGFWLIRER